MKIIRKNTLKHFFGNIFFKLYYENSKWIDNPTTPSEVTRLEKYQSVFKKYAAEYIFDWLSVAAMTYQESKIDQSKITPKAVVGIMQIEPDIAASNAVGITNMDDAENNLNAGIKCLTHLHKHYFTSDNIVLVDQIDFTCAAYKAGPGRH